MPDVTTWEFVERRDSLVIRDSDAADSVVLAHAIRGWKSRGSNWSGWVVLSGTAPIPYAGPFRNKRLMREAAKSMARRSVEFAAKYTTMEWS